MDGTDYLQNNILNLQNIYNFMIGCTIMSSKICSIIYKKENRNRSFFISAIIFLSWW